VIIPEPLNVDRHTGACRFSGRARSNTCRA
jgi:hypothetical protein